MQDRGHSPHEHSTCTSCPVASTCAVSRYKGQEVVDAQVQDALVQLGAAVVAMHQRLQGSPMGPPPLSLMGRRRG
jgi:hypothetical protein